MMKYLISLIIVFYVPSGLAQNSEIDSFTFKHPTCKVYMLQDQGFSPKFSELLVKKIKERNFELTLLKQKIRLSKGDLYFNVDLIRAPKGLYRDCTVDLALRSSKGNHMSSKDKHLFSKKVRRKYPRVTRKGKERCLKALKDVFVHIPTCQKP